jgi:hypothetical protein
MNKIIFPLQSRMRGEAIADLQYGLQLLLDTDIFHSPPASVSSTPIVARPAHY